MSELQQNRTYTMVPVYQILAMQMKYEGATSEEIAAAILNKFQVSYTPSTIRYWFSKPGPLHAAFKEYVFDLNMEVIMDARSRWIRDFPFAQSTLMRNMVKPGMPGVVAAQEWIARAEGAIPQELKLSGGVVVGTVADFVRAVDEARANEQPTPEQPSGSVEAGPDQVLP